MNEIDIYRTYCLIVAALLFAAFAFLIFEGGKTWIAPYLLSAFCCWAAIDE